MGYCGLHDSRMANHLIRGISLLAACLTCTGCIAVWQNDHKIVANTGSAVTIDYDPLLLTSHGVVITAQSECRKFKRVAVLDRVHNGRTWTKRAEFRCEDDPNAPKDVIASLRSAPLAADPEYRSLPSPLPAASPPPVASVAASSSEPSKTDGVTFIDAIGPNWGAARRQVAKPPVAQVKVVGARAAKQPAKPPLSLVKEVRSLKAPNMPVAILKGSLAG